MGSPSDLLTEDTPPIERAKLLLSKVDSIVKRYKNVDRDNVPSQIHFVREESAWPIPKKALANRSCQ